MMNAKQLKWVPKGGRTRKDASVGTIYRCTNYQQLGCQFQVTVVKDKDCYTITVGNLPHSNDVSKREKTGKGLAKEVKKILLLLPNTLKRGAVQQLWFTMNKKKN